MIFDQLSKIDAYACMGERISKAIAYVKATNFAALEIGKYAIDGTDVFAIVSEYQSKPETECKPETHINYIDIQMVVVGSEYIGYAPLVNQTPSIAYNPDKDVMFYAEPCTKVKLEPGLFSMFFPHDIHQPSIMIDEPSTVKKVVVKIRA
jgi:YhcH/YjgK/YiaL family protein